MTEPTFDDDTDTVPTCTGACCDPVTLGVEHYRALSGDPTSFRNGRYVANMLTPRAPVSGEGATEFDCRYFDRETRRCTAYDRRPAMCRTFPETGVCSFCGGRFAAKDPQPDPHAERPAPDEASRPEQARLAAMRTLIMQNSSQATGSERAGRRKRR